MTSESVLRKPTRSAPTASPILLGGDCGGSMRSEGGGTGRGLRGARPCREGDSGPPLLAPSDCRPARCSLSLGLILGTKGGFWVVVDGGGWGAGSRRPSGFGAGDTARGAEPEGGGGGPVGVSPGLVMFSNFARSDDTGFWSCQRVWARGGGRVEGGGLTIDEPSGPLLAGGSMATTAVGEVLVCCAHNTRGCQCRSYEAPTAARRREGGGFVWTRSEKRRRAATTRAWSSVDLVVIGDCGDCAVVREGE